MDDRDDTSRTWFDPSLVHVQADEAVLEFLDEEALIRLSGAPSWSRLIATKTPRGIAITVQNDVVMAMVRHIERRGDETIIRNQVFQVNPDYRGRRFGARALTVQARAAQALGFDAIELDATGNYVMATTGHPRDRHSGYYVWPRLGFDTNIPPSTLRRLPQKYKGCARISDLMASQEGQDDWFIHGDTLNDARFDVAPGSKSWDLLLAYCQQRHIRI
ncbi:hypothetical protein [Roseateles amylovorans]|uniref:N-acetyltransferase domain-containing protein n=1 Tax=Roseateles amylovorans TaxID=2978473 RepID=A0ABY6B3F7_9BURK|nr:hypothetical protein [Roseateles amylovorans]UXH77810.1 hypothetical protein N4261_23005 [Roseateles amylovorans]